MMTTNLLKQSGCIAMMLFSTTLFGQYVIYEDANLNSEKVILDNFNKADYTEISHSDGGKTFVKNQFDKTKNPSAIRSTEDVVTLTLLLSFDQAEYEPLTALIYNDLDYLNFVTYNPDIGGVVIEVPEGVYDIKADFKNIATGSIYTVIRELLEIEDATIVTIDVEEAVNHINIEIFDENGGILHSGIVNDSSATVSNVSVIRISYYEPYNLTLSLGIYQSQEYDEENSEINFYMNDVSDRYSFINSAIGTNFAGGNYYTKFETISEVSGDITIGNNPDQWAHVIEKFEPSLLGQAAEYIYPTYVMKLFYEGKYFMGSVSTNTFTPINPEVGFKLWVNTPQNSDPLDMVVYHGIREFSGILDAFIGYQNIHIYGNTIMSTQDGEALYGSGSRPDYYWSLGNDYLLDETNIKLLNIHPKFSFRASQSPNMVEGNNTPISITAYKPGHLLSKYMGRYGEVRESDFFDTEIEVMQDGIPSFAGGYIDFQSESVLNAGIIELTYINTNIQVDGLAGKNTASLKFNADVYDAPPTLQRLQFRDADDNVTDRFETVAAGRIRIAAGDFQFIPIGAYGGSFNYVEGNNVEVYYSLYDQNNWSELELTEYPEYFQVGYGDYYEASLETVQVAQPNSWFDVRIKCTDAAGNIQDQIISPAFKIEDITVAVDKISKNQDFKVFPNPFTDQLTLSLPANVSGDFTVRITDILGKMIYSENGSIGSSNNLVVQGAALTNGVYILTVETQDELMVKKIVKR